MTDRSARYFIDISDAEALNDLVRELAGSPNDRRRDLMCTVCDADGRELIQVRFDFGVTAPGWSSLRPTTH